MFGISTVEIAAALLGVANIVLLVRRSIWNYVFGLASVPLSSLGAKTALRMQGPSLERLYGAGLLILGATLFFV